MRRTLAVLLLAALVATTGCSGLFRGDSEPAATTTPPPEERLAPGISENGVYNASALVDAHLSQLSDTGFAYTYSSRSVTRMLVEHAADGRLVRREDPHVSVGLAVNGTVRAERGFYPHRHELTRQLEDRHGSDGGGEVATVERVVRYSNGSDGVKRVVRNDITYENYSLARSWDISIPTLFEAVLEAGDWKVTEVTDDGDRIVLRATGPSPAARLNPQWSLDQFSFSGRMVVTSDGLIRSFRGNLTTPEGRPEASGIRVYERNTRVITYTLTQVGNVTVDAPPWLAEARNATE